MADGQEKFLGGVCCGNQARNFTRYFNQVTPQNAGKWGSVQRGPDRFLWNELDQAYSLAKDNGFPFRMHVLVWGDQQPSWIRPLPRGQQLGFIRRWFEAVNARYPDIDVVEVVNEFVNDPPDDNEENGSQPGPRYIDALRFAKEGTTDELRQQFEDDGLSSEEAAAKAARYDWVINAYELARAVFPRSTRLAINEYNVVSDPALAEQMVEVVGLLQARDLVDVVSVQGHAFSLNGTNEQLRANLDLVATTGLDLHVSELDIDGPTDAVQLQEYRRVFPVFWEHPAIQGVTLWGYRPGHWREGQGAHLALNDDSEKPALSWLRGYIRGWAPEVVGPNVADELPEDAAVDTSVITLDASGPDGDSLDATLRWKLLGGTGSSAFAIDSESGEVTVKATPAGGTNVLQLQVEAQRDDGEWYGSELFELEVPVAGNAQAMATVTTYDFTVDEQGFRGDYGTGAVATRDPDTSTLVVTPDWSADAQNIIGEIASTDYTGASIEYTVTVTQAQVDGGMAAQGFIQTGAPNYTRIYGDPQALTAGSNTFTYEPVDNGNGDIRIVERVGIEFVGPLTSGVEDPIFINQVVVTIPPE